MAASILSRPLTLPNGVVIRNRLVKSAMSEVLGSPANKVSKGLPALYKRWSEGEIGLSITGNVMIDHRALGEPGNVVVEDESDLEALSQWAAAGKRGGGQIWMQINHPGKQAPKGLNKETVAPSAIPFNAKLSFAFATPRELEEFEILEIIKRFAETSRIAKKSGFDGVQIHAAHGYLVSQFLSGHHNQRTDKWGGTPEKRRLFLLEIVAEIRKQVGPNFPIGIKINSADFQKGGFTESESLATLIDLERSGIDLIEISGGNYEAPVMTGTQKLKESTKQREAYFLEFAEKARKTIKTPIVLTGGFRTPEVMTAAIESGAIDFVGLARSLVIEPDLPKRLLSGLPPLQVVTRRTTGFTLLDQLIVIEISWYERQIERLSRGLEPKPTEHGLFTFFGSIWKFGFGMFRKRKLRA
jgi:2,4-dienoyl-CoA reductase-like NADH-dependent reductase (Old Yellow Enzyme family)